MPGFFQKMEKLRPLYDWTYKIVLLICKLLLVGDIFVTCWAVLGRYVSFISDPHWSEEIVLTFMAYMAVLSATLAIRKRSHIRMTAFDNVLPKTCIKVLDLIADIAVLALGVVLLVYGIKFCNSPLAAKGKYATLTHLSKVWQYLPIPVAGFSMIVFELEQVFQRIEAFFVSDEKEAKQA